MVNIVGDGKHTITMTRSIVLLVRRLQDDLYLQYFISHGRLNVDLQLRPRQDVHVDDISKVLELLFRLHVAGLFDVPVQLTNDKKTAQ